MYNTHLGSGILSTIHVKIHVSEQGFSNLASDWLAAVMPVKYQVWKSLLINIDVNMEIY